MTTDATDDLLALLTLRFTPHLGPQRATLLLRAFGSARAVLAADETTLREVPGLDRRVRRALVAREGEAAAGRELQAARPQGVTLLGRGLPGYPEALEALPDPPTVLWARGPLPPLAVVPRAVGIVGTRAASGAALDFTRRLTLELAEADVVIVSGFARGIDAAAHRAAVAGGAPTLGVLGCGVDVVYPAEHAGLRDRVTLLSEHPLGTRPAPHNFPERNRLIAALSAGSVVVQGALTSGAMLTASAALECGRTVFAVPGPPGDPLAAGPHRLLREGAVLVERAADILDEFGWRAGPTRAADGLLPAEVRLLTVLQGPTLLDDLAVRLALPLPEVQAAVMRLRVRGLVVETPGGRYTRA